MREVEGAGNMLRSCSSCFSGSIYGSLHGRGILTSSSLYFNMA